MRQRKSLNRKNYSYYILGVTNVKAHNLAQNWIFGGHDLDREDSTIPLEVYAPPQYSTVYSTLVQYNMILNR